MFSIGEFARHGRVSVRMLRHYDSLGLLRPASVDPLTGYRTYEAAQFARLNRIVALKDLGFTLSQVQSILDDKVSTEELHGMLRLREAELHTRVATDTARLAQVKLRLAIIEREGIMPTDDIAIKPIPAVTVAELSGQASGFEPSAIGPVVGPLFDGLCERLDRLGVQPAGPGIAYYEHRGDGEVTAHAAIPVSPPLSEKPLADQEVSVVDLPAVEQAATIVHRGSMDDVMASIQSMARWIDANELRAIGPSREVYLVTGPDPADWVTELQEPVVSRKWEPGPLTAEEQ